MSYTLLLMLSDHSEHTEHPTPRRLEQARRDGNVARSASLVSAGVCLGIVIALAICGSHLVAGLLAVLRESVTEATMMATDPVAIPNQVRTIAGRTSALVLPIVALALVSAVFMNVVQFGIPFAPANIQPRFQRLSPARGLRRIFSMRSPARMTMDLVRVLIVGGIVAWQLSRLIPEITGLLEIGPGRSAMWLGRTLIDLGFVTASALVAVGLFDLLIERRRFIADHRMTRHELREEVSDRRKPAPFHRQADAIRDVSGPTPP